MQLISSLVPSAHLVLLFCLSNSKAYLYDLWMRYPNIYLFDLLACLILDCMTALVRVLSLFASFLNLSSHQYVEDHSLLHEWHMLLDHLLPGLREVHRSSPQSPNQQGHCICAPFNWDLLPRGSLVANGALNLYTS